MLPNGYTTSPATLRTSSSQIDVEITSIVRHDGGTGWVNGAKRNKQRSGGWMPFSVHFRSGDPSRTDGADKPHPKLVLAAASAAWKN